MLLLLHLCSMFVPFVYHCCLMLVHVFAMIVHIIVEQLLCHLCAMFVRLLCKLYVNFVYVCHVCVLFAQYLCYVCQMLFNLCARVVYSSFHNEQQGVA